MKIVKHISIVLLCFLGSIQGQAKIKLAALFSDNMILQQQQRVPVWGWAEKNENINVTTSWNAKTYQVKVDTNGKWKLAVQTPSAGGPYTIEVSQSTEKIVINNVLIGEVWLCSGQSNMEMPLKGFSGQPVKNGNDVIVKSTNSNIRLITVPRASVLVPQENFEGKWEVAAPQTTSNFSATAFPVVSNS